MKYLSVSAMLAAVLLSAPACSAESPDQTAQAAPETAPTTSASSGSKFNFAVPGDDADVQPASGGFNFSVPTDDAAPASGGLGAVALPEHEGEELADFKPSLEIPDDAPEVIEE